MRHLRPDYNRIQAPEHRIPEDEPVFLIRGQDTLGPEIVREWAIRARKAGCQSSIVVAAFDQAQSMVEWQHKHGSKIPDMPTPGGREAHGRQTETQECQICHNKLMAPVLVVEGKLILYACRECGAVVCPQAIHYVEPIYRPKPSNYSEGFS